MTGAQVHGGLPGVLKHRFHRPAGCSVQWIFFTLHPSMRLPFAVQIDAPRWRAHRQVATFHRRTPSVKLGPNSRSFGCERSALGKVPAFAAAGMNLLATAKSAAEPWRRAGFHPANRSKWVAALWLDCPDQRADAQIARISSGVGTRTLPGFLEERRGTHPGFLPDAHPHLPR